MGLAAIYSQLGAVYNLSSLCRQVFSVDQGEAQQLHDKSSTDDHGERRKIPGLSLTDQSGEKRGQDSPEIKARVHQNDQAGENYQNLLSEIPLGGPSFLTEVPIGRGVDASAFQIGMLNAVPPQARGDQTQSDLTPLMVGINPPVGGPFQFPFESTPLPEGVEYDDLCTPEGVTQPKSSLNDSPEESAIGIKKLAEPQTNGQRVGGVALDEMFTYEKEGHGLFKGELEEEPIRDSAQEGEQQGGMLIEEAQNEGPHVPSPQPISLESTGREDGDKLRYLVGRSPTTLNYLIEIPEKLESAASITTVEVQRDGDPGSEKSGDVLGMGDEAPEYFPIEDSRSWHTSIPDDSQEHDKANDLGTDDEEWNATGDDDMDGGNWSSWLSPGG